VAAVALIAGLAGPTLIACSQSPEGMVACLGQRVAGTGLLPPGAPPAAPIAPEAAAPAGQAPLDAGVAAGPAITLLRAEPDGSLVIAGSGKSRARIEAYADGELLGTAQAEPSGDWVMVPETPLPAGGVVITVGEAGSGVRAGQAFVVLIDPARTAEPVVVATTPGEASHVLQGLPPPPGTSPDAAGTIR